MKKIYFFLLFILIYSYSEAQTFSFTYDGLLRTYVVYTPTDYNPEISYPLVFNLHGLGSNALEQEYYSGFDFVADTAGIIMVYPNGVDNEWNIFSVNGVDDVGFISALIDTMAANYNIDQDRVYSTGMSMGGFMSHRLACELENRIAAIASVAGVLAFSPCEPSRPMPVMQIHGTSDDVVPYAYVEATIAHWTSYDNCPADPVITELPDIDTTDGCTVTLSTYGLCDDSTEVRLYTINGGGHTWPGATVLIGVTDMDINASVEIWNFFRKYRLPLDVSVSENDMPAGSVTFYPNPFNSWTTVDVRKAEFLPYKLTIFDLSGKDS